MADYYPLLARALDALPNSSPAMRKAVYDRARQALTAQLRSLDPPVSEPDIAAEQRALDAAIGKLETALRGPDESSPEPPQPAPKPTRTEPEPPRPVAEPQRPAPELRTEAEKAEANSADVETANTRQDSLLRPGASPPPTPHPAAAAPTLPEAPALPAAEPLAVNEDLFVSPPEPKPEPRTDFVAFIPPPRKPKGGAAGAAAPLVVPPPPPESASEPKVEPGNETTIAPIVPPPENGAARRPKIDVVAPSSGRSRAVRNAFIGIVLGLVIAAIAVVAFLLRDEPANLSQADDADGSATSQDEQKFGDRVGGEGEARRPSSAATAPEVSVAQRAILIQENKADPQGQPTTETGRTVWRLEPVNGEQGQPLQTTVRATAEFPDAGVTLTVTIRKNTEATLPASHIIELDFGLSGRYAGQVVEEIGLPQFKDDPNGRGASVSGLPVRVRDNLFLIGLSNLPSDVTRNRDMMLQRGWMDIALRFRSGQRAVIALEKGASGSQIMQAAFDQWQD